MIILLQLAPNILREEKSPEEMCYRLL